MNDGGISITGLTIGGAALTAIGGMVGAWLKARYGRTTITPQPLEVREVSAAYNHGLCESRHKLLEGQIVELFACSHAALREARETKGALDTLHTQIASLDRKLDALLSRGAP